MILTWILVTSVVAGLAGLAALALEGACRALQLPTRWPWVAAIAFSVAWPVWTTVRPSTRLHPVALSLAASPVLPAVIVASDHAFRMLSQFLAGVGQHLSLEICVAWFILSVLLLSRLGMGLVRVRRDRRTWTARDVDGVRVLIAPDAGPAVVGIRQYAIVFPAWMLGLEPALRRLVLTHEEEHIMARDPLLRLFGILATSVMPWNAALWWQVRRLMCATETDCDARVLRGPVDRQRYAHLLLAIAQRQSAAMLAPALSWPTSHLERRILAMRRTTPRRPLLVAAPLLGVAAAAIVLACSTSAPNAPSNASNAQATGPNLATNANQAANGAYFDFRVDKQARAYPDNPRPQYPDTLQKAGINGEVTFQFVIDTTGYIDMNTVKVIKTDNDLFTSSVQSIMTRLRFHPAEIKAHPVKEIVEVPFMFRVGPKS